ncbi:hypothetical protein GOV14_00180 [Candidatus Pacearchaeota archaeon]|nr:hypothetical protein [Candidatus Pacearchaeota archaeon]
MFGKKRGLVEKTANKQELKDLKDMLVFYQEASLQNPSPGNIARRHFSAIQYYHLLHQNTGSKRHLRKYQTACNSFSELFNYRDKSPPTYDPRAKKQNSNA